MDNIWGDIANFGVGALAGTGVNYLTGNTFDPMGQIPSFLDNTGSLQTKDYLLKDMLPTVGSMAVTIPASIMLGNMLGGRSKKSKYLISGALASMAVPFGMRLSRDIMGVGEPSLIKKKMVDWFGGIKD